MLDCRQMIRNLIFDWSGTLVDDLPAVWQATNYVFQRAGVAELSLEKFRAEFCLPFTDFYERYVAHVPVAQLEQWFHAAYRRLADAVVELPHAREFLAWCRERGVRMFVLSSVHRDHWAAQTALAVSTKIGVHAPMNMRRAWVIIVRPSMLGRDRSVTTKSGWYFPIFSRPSRPSSETMTFATLAKAF